MERGVEPLLKQSGTSSKRRGVCRKEVRQVVAMPLEQQLDVRRKLSGACTWTTSEW
jgi:hypothetical protein